MIERTLVRPTTFGQRCLSSGGANTYRATESGVEDDILLLEILVHVKVTGKDTSRRAPVRIW